MLKHHPDHSKDPASREVFLAVTQAYEILSDSSKKFAYDEELNALAKRIAEREREQAEKSRQAVERAARAAAAATNVATPAAPSAPPYNVPAEIQRLNRHFSRGQNAEALKLAQEITKVDPRHPIPYAIMGDLARRRGDVNEAARMYAYAAQFEPSNPIYQRRYEELLNTTQVVEGKQQKTSLAAEDRKVLAPMVGGLVILLAAIYLALGSERPILTAIPMVSTWTLGVLVMQFLSGVSLGASFASGNLLDRFQSVSITATGRPGPVLALALVAVVNFWAAALLYLLLGALQRAFDYSTTRTVLGVSATTLLLTVGGAMSHTVDGFQILVWGGNVVYIGSIVGWMVADAFRA